MKLQPKKSTIAVLLHSNVHFLRWVSLLLPIYLPSIRFVFCCCCCCCSFFDAIGHRNCQYLDDDVMFLVFSRSMCGWLISICLTFSYNDFDSPNNYWKRNIYYQITDSKCEIEKKERKWKNVQQPNGRWMAINSENFSRCNDENVYCYLNYTLHIFNGFTNQFS